MKKEIRTEIMINASAEKVWAILSDFDNFSAWNPFVVRVSGKPHVGEILNIEVQLPESRRLKFTPIVLISETNKELRWVGTMPLGMFRGEHFYQIEPLSPNAVRFIHGELFSGWLMGLIWKMVGKATQKGYLLMNEALKKEAEKA